MDRVRASGIGKDRTFNSVFIWEGGVDVLNAMNDR